MNKCIALFIISVILISCGRNPVPHEQDRPIHWLKADEGSAPDEISEMKLKTLNGKVEGSAAKAGIVIRKGGAELHLMLPPESFDAVKEKFGVGSYEEWCKECKIIPKQAFLDHSLSPLSNAFFPKSGEIWIIDNGRYKLIATFTKEYLEYNGLIWDEKKKTTWYFAGNHANTLEKGVVELINAIIPLNLK